MFFIVFFTRSCDPERKERVAVVNGPDNSSDAAEAFYVFEPHAIGVRAKQVKGNLEQIISQVEITTVAPKGRSGPPNFSNN